MEAEKESPLPFTAILLISGISCLFFTTVMKFLGEPMPALFVKIGAGLIAAGLVLFLLKVIAGAHSPTRSRKVHHKS